MGIVSAEISMSLDGYIAGPNDRPGQGLGEGGDLAVGRAGLAASLMELDLIDQYRLYIHPVMIGRGERMFAEFDFRQRPARLVDVQRFGSGVVFLHYTR